MTSVCFMGQVELDVDLKLQAGEAEAVASASTPSELSAIDRGDADVLRRVLGRVRLARVVRSLPWVRSCSLHEGETILAPHVEDARRMIAARGLASC